MSCSWRLRNGTESPSSVTTRKSRLSACVNTKRTPSSHATDAKRSLNDDCRRAPVRRRTCAHVRVVKKKKEGHHCVCACARARARACIMSCVVANGRQSSVERSASMPASTYTGLPISSVTKKRFMAAAAASFFPVMPRRRTDARRTRDAAPAASPARAPVDAAGPCGAPPPPPPFTGRRGHGGGTVHGPHLVRHLRSLGAHRPLGGQPSSGPSAGPWRA